jgi:hypothetical protein
MQLILKGREWSNCLHASQRWQKIGTIKLFGRRMADQCRNYLLGIYRNLTFKERIWGFGCFYLGYTDDLQPDLRNSLALRELRTFFR